MLHKRSFVGPEGAADQPIAPLHIVFKYRTMCTKSFRCLGLIILVAVASFGQSPFANAGFEVVSIKRNTAPSAFAANPPFKGGRLRWTNVTLKEMLSVAYPADINHMYGGPVWIDTERYDVEATTSELSVSDDQYHRMLQAMFADRFRLTLHQETRLEPVYALVPGKQGIKVRSTPDGACTPVAPGTAAQPDQTPCRCSSQTRSHLECVGLTTARLAYILTFTSGRPVIDKTGYEDRFEVNFDFTPGDNVTAGPDEPPTIFDALERHTGLRLQPERGPVEVLVIDHVDRPSAN